MGAAPPRMIGSVALSLVVSVLVACGGSAQATPTTPPTPVPTSQPTLAPTQAALPTATPILTEELTLPAPPRPTSAPTPTRPPTPGTTPSPVATRQPPPAPTPMPVPPDVEVLVRALHGRGLSVREFRVGVLITPRNMGVSAARVVLAFDPDVMEAVEVTPGRFLGPSPLIFRADVSDPQGSISFIAARRGPTPELGGSGLLMTVRFLKKSEDEMPKPVAMVEALELVGADFEFIKNIEVDVR